MGVKKVLILDVDETILNIEPIFFLKRFRKDYSNYNGKLVDFIGREYYMVPRPRLKESLDIASSHFDLVAYSVINRDITTRKLEILGIKDYFIKIYGREDLIDKKKSLKKISEDLGVETNDIIAIDDTPDIFFEIANVIPVKPFLIGKDEEYEYQEHSDNLFGAINQALIRQSIKVVSPVN